MKRKWIKWVSWILLTPVILFVILMVLLYIPPVQNFIRQEATAYASEKTGMQIQIRRIDLRFPLNLLVHDAKVIQAPDTLLVMESLNVRIQALPLFVGKVEIDNVTLKHVAVNSADLMKGMSVKGVLGYFFLNSHCVDLSDKTATINLAELSDSYLQLSLNDTTATPKDTTASAPINWKVSLRQMKLDNVSFGMQLPADSIRMVAHIGEASVNDATADLKNQFYGLKKILLSGASVKYDTGTATPAQGFDPAHIAIRDIRIGVDSLLYRGKNMNAVIREFSLNERSGLSITSLTGRFFSNNTIIRPQLKLLTPHSEVNFSAQTYWKLIQIPTSGHLAAHLDANIGREDVFLYLGGLPESFKKAYPFRPIMIGASTEGNLKQMQISRLTVDLPGAFSIKGGGVLENLTDSITRFGSMGLNMTTGNLNFLTGLTGTTPNRSFVIPSSMNLAAHVDVKGNQYKADLKLKEGDGGLTLNAALDGSSEVYTADLKVTDLQLHDFLPKDSIYKLSASASVSGRGLDVLSRRSQAKFHFNLDKLHYGRYDISDVRLSGDIKGALATAHLTSNNRLLKMTADAEYNLAHHYPDGKLSVDLAQLDLYELRLAPKPLRHPFVLNFTGEAHKDKIMASLASGDLNLEFKARSGIYPLMKQTTQFVKVLAKQLDDKLLNHTELRKVLPTAVFSLTAGRENLLAYYLSTKDIAYQDISVEFGTDSNLGINGKATIHELKVDTLQLDTIFFTVKQDTTQMHLRGGVINGPKNPQITFKSALTGEIRDEDAELTVEYQNEKGETGVLLGVRVRPLKEVQGKGGGVAFTLIPQEPVIAFRKFHFKDKHNWVYLHKNMRVYANVEMLDKEGMGFRMHSIREDTVSLQNMDIELRQIRLNEISKVLPYLPDISGILSAEAHYIQSEKDLQVSIEGSIDELTYERQRIGDISIGATWLPGEKGKQYVNTYLTHEGKEVMVGDGTLTPTGTGKDSIAVNATLEHFPLSIANVFIPDKMVDLSGGMAGDLHISGSTQQPLVNGELVLDSVSAYLRQLGGHFAFDNRPVQVENSRMLFNKFSIYTTSKNPLTIDGYVDFRDMSRPMANLNILAENFVLLDAKHTRESLVYGKVLVDFRSTLKGPLDGLIMRGNMNLLGSTDVTYVLKDSPLVVQDRLSSIVTFTSFSDTTTVIQQQVPTVSLGGLNMIMTLNIDPSVRLKADLSPDRSNRVELEGGGNLTLKYTPQGDLTLAGRYSLTGGILKYELPVIKAKEFQINNGSYIEWSGNPSEPTLNFKASDRIRASVPDGGDKSSTHMVNFDVSVAVKNQLKNLSLLFDIAAPEDAAIQNQLATMEPEERGKQAVALMVTGTYLGAGMGSGGNSNLKMGAALNSVLMGQINSLLGNLKNASLSVGMEGHDDVNSGNNRTDFSFRYSQRLFNDRFQIVFGGKVSTGANAVNTAESFIDNVSLEYRLDGTGMRNIRLFYDKNYESVLEGEITEAGVGLVLRKKLDNLGELFVFKKKKKPIVLPTR